MNLALILPEITLFCGALTILMLDVYLGKRIKDFFYISHFLALLICAITLLLISKNFVISQHLFSNMFVSNGFTSFTKGITVTLLTVVVLLSFNFVSTIQKISAEFLALMMIATTGGLILLSANDFLVFYLGLELQALSLYLMAALNKSSKKSSEAGMKYFILGCLASGILLFGISMIYGFSGTTNFSALSDLYQNNKLTATENIIPIGVIFGFILVITAMFFKIAAAPFHMWSPDVYEGSPSIVTTFFATVAKFSVALVFLRLFLDIKIGWIGMEKIFIFTAIVSLAIGSFGAIFQKNFKRLLAYSSISHVGFFLLGLATFNKQGFSAAAFYMVIYAIISLGSFGFLTLIKGKKDQESDKDNEKIFAISSLGGLAKKSPVMAFSLSALMFSTAGIPPLAGFFSKFYILAAAIGGGYLYVSIAAVIFSVISAYYYLRIVKIMYFDEVSDAMQINDIPNAKLVILVTAIFNIVAIFFLNSILSSINNFIS